MESDVYEGKVNTRGELLTRMKQSEDQLRKTTHNLRTRVVKCIQV